MQGLEAQSIVFAAAGQKSSSSMGRLKAELHCLRSGRVMRFTMNNAG
jgi:hypothetical protein